MKTIIITFLMLLATTQLKAQEVRLLDPTILGSTTDESVKLLLPADTKAIQPMSIQIDIKAGKVSGAMLVYSRDVTFDQARKSLNKLYEQYQLSSAAENSQQALWRIVNKKFAIHLALIDDTIRIMYLPFKKPGEYLNKSDDKGNVNTEQKDVRDRLAPRNP